MIDSKGFGCLFPWYKLSDKQWMTFIFNSINVFDKPTYTVVKFSTVVKMTIDK